MTKRADAKHDAEQSLDPAGAVGQRVQAALAGATTAARFTTLVALAALAFLVRSSTAHAYDPTDFSGCAKHHAPRDITPHFNPAKSVGVGLHPLVAQTWHRHAPNQNLVFVSTQTGVDIIKASGPTKLDSISLGEKAKGLAIAPDYADPTHTLLFVVTLTKIRFFDITATTITNPTASEKYMPGLEFGDDSEGPSHVVATSNGERAFVSIERVGQDHGYVQEIVMDPSVCNPNDVEPFPCLGDTMSVDKNPVGLAFSSDESRLYVTNEQAGDVAAPEQPIGNQVGALMVFDISDGSFDYLTAIKAGCSAVRVSVTRDPTDDDDDIVWVTARGDHRLYAFDASEIEDDPHSSFLARVDTGADPTGVQVWFNPNGGLRVAVASSNRFDSGTFHASTMIWDADQVLAGGNPLPLRTYWTHGHDADDWPRELGVDGSYLYVTEYDNKRLDQIALSNIP